MSKNETDSIKNALQIQKKPYQKNDMKTKTKLKLEY